MSEAFLPFCRPDIRAEDIAAVVDVLNSGWITTGPRSAELETAFRERLGCRHAVAVASATGAMHLYLHALGIGPGDEVITPSMTWVSTVNLIRLAGAEPVFADVDADTLMVGAEELDSLVSERTRALIPVHFAGAPLDLDPIRALAARRGLPLVEDAAHVLGARYGGQAIGSEGTAIFSLQAIKNVTAAEGGVVVTDDDALAERLRRLRFHGLGMDSHERHSQGRAPQAEVHEPGFKYNLPDLCAALALSQFGRLDAINAQRRALAEHYLSRLADIDEVRPLQPPAWPHEHAWHLFVVRVVGGPLGRDAFIEAMKSHGIGCGIHFRAVHLQRYYREHPPARARDLPHTRWNSERICSLPLFPAMTFADVDRVVAAIKAVLAG
ncbi:MAG: aminotransferase class I/II-fold pyridoxal phosphate-dependent enzyme [Pseudomonadales bacterium]